MSLRATSLSLLAVFGFVFGVVGCAPDADQPTTPEDGESEDAASAASNSTYYRIVGQDFRKCMFPMCGGVYVARVNFPETKCSDGSWQKQCYVAAVDYKALGLSEAQAAFVDGEADQGRVLLRGTFVSQKFGAATGTALKVVEAWNQLGKGAPTGTFYRVKDNGIRCITTPCFSVGEAKLNSSIAKNVSGLDLSGALLGGDDDSRIWNAFSESAVMLAGTNKTVTESGPTGATKGTALVATAAYVRVVAGGGFCTEDKECAMTVYTKDVDSKSECYCRTCPSAIDASEAKSNESAWLATCSKVKMTCPQVKCMFREAVCVANQCTAQAPKN